MTADVWLPIPPDEIEGLPEGPAYRHWDGEEAFPADPADCAFYVVPYMKPSTVGVRPLPGMRSVQVVQTLSAGIDHVEPGLGHLPAVTELPRLLPQADVVILSTPLTEATRGLAGAEFLARMKDGALLVNVARGPVVDTKALLAELESGRLTAALDVTDPEPLPPGHPLWHAPGIVVSPHAGGPTSAFLPRAERLLVDQLTRFVNREPLRNVILTTGS